MEDQIDVRTVDRDSLVDITTVAVDRRLPKEERIRDYVEKVRNPRCFRVGDIVVKVSFTENGKPLQECLEDFISQA